MSIRDLVGRPRFDSPLEEAMVFLLVTAGHLSRALHTTCAEFGITHDQYNVLRILRGAHPRGHPRYAIADRLIDKAPDVTRILDRLVRDGLVERFRSEEDRRLSISRITASGLALLEELDPRIGDVHLGFAGHLEDGELRSLSGLLERIGAR